MTLLHHCPAVGITYVEPDADVDNDERIHFRFGPAFNFGKHTRIQINGEVEDRIGGFDTAFILRSQATLDFRTDHCR